MESGAAPRASPPHAPPRQRSEAVMKIRYGAPRVSTKPRELWDCFRFWSKVDQSSGDCWTWTAATYQGYGRFQVGGPKGNRTVAAHRMAWELTHGPIPDKLHVLHHCDNPPCCRPEHLFLGTIRDNNADAQAKDRMPQCRRQTVEAIKHGTIAGYVAHQRWDPPPCPECRAAKAAYDHARLRKLACE
jgi:hypothetical protein